MGNYRLDLVDSGLNLSDSLAQRHAILSRVSDAINQQLPETLMGLVADYICVPGNKGGFVVPFNALADNEMKHKRREFSIYVDELECKYPIGSLDCDKRGLWKSQTGNDGDDDTKCVLDDDGCIEFTMDSEHRIIDIAEHGCVDDKRVAIVYAYQTRGGLLNFNVELLPEIE